MNPIGQGFCREATKYRGVNNTESLRREDVEDLFENVGKIQCDAITALQAQLRQDTSTQCHLYH